MVMSAAEIDEVRQKFLAAKKASNEDPRNSAKLTEWLFQQRQFNKACQGVVKDEEAERDGVLKSVASLRKRATDTNWEDRDATRELVNAQDRLIKLISAK